MEESLTVWIEIPAERGGWGLGGQAEGSKGTENNFISLAESSRNTKG